VISAEAEIPYADFVIESWIANDPASGGRSDAAIQTIRPAGEPLDEPTPVLASVELLNELLRAIVDVLDVRDVFPRIACAQLRAGVDPCPTVATTARNGTPGRLPFPPYRGIAAYCDHPVRFGVVESINTTIKAVLRRARGMRDEQMLLLKLKWTTAHPIRSARDLARFLSPQGMYSNQ
jgi:hypothetical protein